MEKVLLYLHIPKAGGTTLGECIYREVHSKTNYEEYGGWFNSGVYYFPTGFSEYCSKHNAPPAHKVNEVLLHSDLRAVVGHFSFGLHLNIPRSSTYVSMIREPIDRVLSLFHHLKWVGDLPRETTVEEFLKKTGFPESSNDQVYRISGLPRELYNQQDALKRAIENITQYFEFVGVTELFDESLVLMKRKLGWRQDLAYFARNVNPERSEEEKKITENDISLIMEANQLDIALYNQVKSGFKMKIKEEGSSFLEEVSDLRQVRAEWEM